MDTDQHRCSCVKLGPYLSPGATSTSTSTCSPIAALTDNRTAESYDESSQESSFQSSPESITENSPESSLHSVFNG
jgi:hypothetical protein